MRCSDCRRVITARRKRTTDCAFGYKYTAKGTMIVNAKHECGAECSWSWQEAQAWNPPYIMLTPSGEMKRMQHRLVPVPPCVNCDRPRRDHWAVKSDADGNLLGFGQIKECQYAAA